MNRDEPIQRFTRAYSRFVTRLWERERRLARQYGISAAQMSLLRKIEFLGPSSLSDVHELVGGHLSALGQMLDRLEQAGWVDRTRDQTDRRKIVITLRDRARSVLEREPLFGPARVCRELETMSAAEATEVVEAMELVTNMMLGPETVDDEVRPPVGSQRG